MYSQPVEDISVVMGRFEAWAGSRHGREARPGVRELSSEEALASGRYHWKTHKGAHASAAVADTSSSTSQPQPSPPVSASAKPRKAGRISSAKMRSRSREARPPARTAASKAMEMVESAAKSPSAAADPAMRLAPFKDALAQAIRPAEAAISSTPPADLARQVAVSIRLAASERVLIRARATEAGVTVSAYIRQCVLEVEQLRAQVQQTLGTIAGNAPASMQMRVPSVFVRLLRRFFPSKARTLAVRA